MSIGAISSSQLGGILSSMVSNVTAAGIVSATANGGGSGFATAGSTPVTSEFTGLLKSLASGDQAGASAALQELQQSLGTVPAGASAPPTDPAGAFSAFVQSLSNSLSSGDLALALGSLTSFLVSANQASGNGVNTSA